MGGGGEQGGGGVTGEVVIRQGSGEVYGYPPLGLGLGLTRGCRIDG